EAEQTGLTTGGESGPAGHIQKWRSGARAVALNDLDMPALLDHEETAAVVVRLLDIKRICKAVRHLHQFKGSGRRRRGRGGRRAAIAAAPARKCCKRANYGSGRK